MIDWNKINQDTLVKEKYCYFDTGAAAPPPKQVIDDVVTYLRKTAEIGIYLPSFRKEAYAYIDVVRSKMASFIQCDADEIAFTKNGTESICIVANGISWNEGDEVIVPDTEMLSNISVWYNLQDTHKIRVVRVKANADGIIEAGEIEKAITKRTRLITFVALSNVTGAIQPVKEICAVAKKHNVLTHVNASQALGFININIQEWQCDFLSACGRKGLRAIEGSGILYVKKAHIEMLNPILVGWWNSSLDQTSSALILLKTAKRFEAGCPILPAIVSLGSALDIAEKIGIAEIEARNHQLTQYALAQLATIPGFEYYGPKSVANAIGLIPFNIKSVHPDTLTNELEKRKIIIESGHFMAASILQKYHIEKMARMSLHYFNDEQEIDLLVKSIKSIIEESKQ